MHKYRNIFIISLIVLLGFALRIWHIAGIPPGLNRDEASIGYTAYSILKTGKDEYGRFLPLSFESFGDWKLPLYIYLTVPFVAIFGLTDFAVRIPAGILAAITTFNVFFLSRALFVFPSYSSPDKNRERIRGVYTEKLPKWFFSVYTETNLSFFSRNKKIAFLSAFMFALSPWSIHLSRNASESTVSIFLTTLGVLCFLKGKRSYLLILAALLLSAPIYTYHGNHIFSPVFFSGLFIFAWLKKMHRKKLLLISLVIFMVSSGFIYQKTLLMADRTKIYGLFAALDPALLYEQVNLSRIEHPDHSLVGTLFHNKYIFTVNSILDNYTKGFSPEFLFITGGANSQHNIPNFGNLYLWEAPFILIGLYFILANKNKYRGLLLWWLLIAPVAASITKDAPHTNRMAAILPLPHLFSAYGFIALFYILKKRYSDNSITRPLFITLIFLLFANFLIWTDRYFTHFPIRREAAWGAGYSKLVSEVTKIRSNYKEIIMDRPDYSPYIYFLFYQNSDPATAQKEIVRYPYDSEGFRHVKSLGNIEFKKLNWSTELLIPDRLIISWAESTPRHATKSAAVVDETILDQLNLEFGDNRGLVYGDIIESSLREVIRLKNGQPQFYLIEVKKLQ